MYQKATLYQNAKIDQDMKVLIAWSEKRNYFDGLANQAWNKFAEGEKIRNSLGNSCSEM